MLQRREIAIFFIFIVLAFLCNCTMVRPLPEGVPRFVNNGDGTITDNATDLMWEASTGNGGNICLYIVAKQYVESLRICGYEDWELPTLAQLRTLINNDFYPMIDPMFECKEAKYWSRNVGYYKGALRTRTALSFKDGKTKYFLGAGFDYYVRAVRKFP